MPRAVERARRLWAAWRGGTLGFKILNRLSAVKFVPGPAHVIDDYLAKHNPGNGDWRVWSPAARKTWVQFHPLFEHHQIRAIADVGAHAGHLALALNEAFPGRTFFLFEPVPSTFRVLAENTSSFENMRAFPIAAGAVEGEKRMYVDAFSPACSLLPYAPIALAEYPFLGKQVEITVRVRPLDSVMAEEKVSRVDLLIMDVQGYENEVLAGAVRTLESCAAVVSELSLQRLYQGSSTFDSVYQQLVSSGFELRDLFNPMHGQSLHILQIDGVFERVGHE